MNAGKIALVVAAIAGLCCVGSCGLVLLAGASEVDDQNVRANHPLVGHWYYGIEAISRFTRDVGDDWKSSGGSGSEYTFRSDGSCSMDSVRALKVTDFCSSYVIVGTDDCRWSLTDDSLRINLGERKQYTRACGSSDMKSSTAEPTELHFRLEMPAGLPVLHSDEGPALELRRAP